MEFFKRAFRAILSGSMIFLLFYLLGSFTQASFDVSIWGDTEREFVATFGGFVSFVVMCINWYSE